ncbi:MAG: purine-nucleoside phosphorylase [Caldiserica bacterium]|nr:purine-nucleoside phosphorylase [Caldisericota bacterium]
MEKTFKFLEKYKKYNPEFAIIIGTGLSSILDKIKVLERVAYKDIPSFPVSTVIGHKGEIVFGKLSGKNLVAFNGRFHFYEGYSMKEVTTTVRAANFLGAKTLIVSNASGAVNPVLRAGDILLIKDHVNFIFAENPLRGEKGNERFVNLTDAYDKDLREKFIKVADKNGIRVIEGVYCAVSGPNFETIAELELMGRLGIDAVGMSTVPEVIIARYLNMKVLGISCITDNVFFEGEVSHLQVVDVAEKCGKIISKLIEDFLKEI